MQKKWADIVFVRQKIITKIIGNKKEEACRKTNIGLFGFYCHFDLSTRYSCFCAISMVFRYRSHPLGSPVTVSSPFNVAFGEGLDAIEYIYE